MTDNSYTRTPDGATMVEIAPHQFVNINAARKLGLLGRAQHRAPEQHELVATDGIKASTEPAIAELNT